MIGVFGILFRKLFDFGSSEIDRNSNQSVWLPQIIDAKKSNLKKLILDLISDLKFNLKHVQEIESGKFEIIFIINDQFGWVQNEPLTIKLSGEKGSENLNYSVWSDSFHLMNNKEKIISHFFSLLKSKIINQNNLGNSEKNKLPDLKSFSELISEIGQGTYERMNEYTMKLKKSNMTKLEIRNELIKFGLSETNADAFIRINKIY
jgi:hypothetical protein